MKMFSKFRNIDEYFGKEENDYKKLLASVNRFKNRFPDSNEILIAKLDSLLKINRQMSYDKISLLSTELDGITYERTKCHNSTIPGTSLFEPMNDYNDFITFKHNIEDVINDYVRYAFAAEKGYLSDCVKSGGCGLETIYFTKSSMNKKIDKTKINKEFFETYEKLNNNSMKKECVFVKNPVDLLNPSKRYEKFNNSIAELRKLLNDETILEGVEVDIFCDLLDMHALAASIKALNIGEAYSKAISEIKDNNLDKQAELLNKVRGIIKDLAPDVEEFITWEQAKADGKYEYAVYAGCGDKEMKIAYIKKSEKDFEGPITKETILDIVTKKIGDFLANKLKGNDNLLNDVLTNLNAKKNIDELIKELENNNDSLAESIKELRLRQIEGEIEANEDTILKNIFKVKKEVKTKTVYKDRVVEVERPSYGGCGYSGSYGGGCGTSTSYSGGCGYSSYRGGC